MEVPVRRILMGAPLDEAANPSVMRNPASLDYFLSFANSAAGY
jgi:acetoacetyl-CoA synthetase